VTWLAVTALIAACAYFVGVVWLTNRYWYLRSLTNADTHLGELRPDGTVLAFDCAGPCGSPSDAGQVCPASTGPAR
jgi:hypothetical protein